MNLKQRVSPTKLMLVAVSLYTCSHISFAASPQDIRFSGKGNSLLGGAYHIYKVRCSDGSKRTISAWNDRKKWCAGNKKNQCTNDQLTTAKKVCK
jgi:hypothetical protein